MCIKEFSLDNIDVRRKIRGKTQNKIPIFNLPSSIFMLPEALTPSRVK